HRLLADLGVSPTIGAGLASRTVQDVLDFYVDLLEGAVTGGNARGCDAQPDTAQVGSRRDVDALHCQVEFVPPDDSEGESPGAEPVITLSGGVGELAYRCARGEPLPGTTAFGDLGIDLARRICASPILGGDLTSHMPSGL